jgi:hypothetical protein
MYVTDVLFMTPAIQQQMKVIRPYLPLHATPDKHFLTCQGHRPPTEGRSTVLASSITATQSLASQDCAANPFWYGPCLHAPPPLVCNENCGRHPGLVPTSTIGKLVSVDREVPQLNPPLPASSAVDSNRCLGFENSPPGKPLLLNDRAAGSGLNENCCSQVRKLIH